MVPASCRASRFLLWLPRPQSINRVNSFLLEVLLISALYGSRKHTRAGPWHTQHWCNSSRPSAAAEVSILNASPSTPQAAARARCQGRHDSQPRTEAKDAVQHAREEKQKQNFRKRVNDVKLSKHLQNSRCKIKKNWDRQAWAFQSSLSSWGDKTEQGICLKFTLSD